MSSGATAQDSAWKAREMGNEAQWAREREQKQLADLRSKIGADTPTRRAAGESSPANTNSNHPSSQVQRDRDEFEGGFGGQEDLEDRYATTSGEH